MHVRRASWQLLSSSPSRTHVAKVVRHAFAASESNGAAPASSTARVSASSVVAVVGADEHAPRIDAPTMNAASEERETEGVDFDRMGGSKGGRKRAGIAACLVPTFRAKATAGSITTSRGYFGA
jgi:hypothetical protein